MGHLGRPRVMPLALITIALLVTPFLASTEENVQWQSGPVMAQLGGIAELQVPEGYAFTGKAGTKKLLELTHNIVAGNELGALVPADSSSEWFAIFQFDDVGYVKDDDKDKIDANALFKTIQDGTERANKERSKKGWATYTVEGWEQPPYYDTNTHNLTWAIRGRASSGGASINHSIRILGRRGTVDVDLVLAPEDYALARPRFDAVMQGFRFKQGNQYADFVKGDKVAAFGLSALVLGGAGAVALKTGLLASSWKLLVGLLLAFKKLLVVVVVALGAALKGLWARFRSVVAPKDEVAGAPPSDGTGGP